MNITPRQQAILERNHRYFTGKPCKRGHICDRYTLNSACVDCVHPKFQSAEMEQKRQLKAALENVREENRLARIDRNRVLAVMTSMPRVRFGLYPQDLEHFTSVVLAVSRMTEPKLLSGDVRSKLKVKPCGAGQFFYGFRVFEKDKMSFFDLQNVLRLQRNPQAKPLPVPMAPGEDNGRPDESKGGVYN